MTELVSPGQSVATSFFKAFSRFEYALKRTRHVRNKEVAEADWDKFADTLLAEPPRKLMRDDQSVRWKEARGIDDVRGLFNAVRQVRNNLFHGEKFTGDARSNSRDTQLLTDALRVLETCPRRE